MLRPKQEEEQGGPQPQWQEEEQLEAAALFRAPQQPSTQRRGPTRVTVWEAITGEVICSFFPLPRISLDDEAESAGAPTHTRDADKPLQGLLCDYGWVD